MKNVGRRFDLVESLEVAEHLDASEADSFIKNLTSLSDIVLFSAAAPLQGGTHHVNEQAPVYWNALFEKYNYVCFDILRDKIWDNEQIAWWYRQNLLIFIKREKIALLEEQGYASTNSPKLYYHPDYVFSKIKWIKKKQQKDEERKRRKIKYRIKNMIHNVFKF